MLTSCYSPSQSREELKKFSVNFMFLIKAISSQKDAISIKMGDFNAWSSNWCKYDISNNEGAQIDSVNSTYGLEQLIYEPTHILSNFPSCIDLIFTKQPSLVVDSGTYPSLHPNCLIVTIKLFTVRLICKFNIHLLIKDRFRIMLKIIRMPSH